MLPFDCQLRMKDAAASLRSWNSQRTQSFGILSASTLPLTCRSSVLS